MLRSSAARPHVASDARCSPCLSLAPACGRADRAAKIKAVCRHSSLRSAAMLRRFVSFSISLLFLTTAAWADDLPIVRGVEAQPLKAQAKRVAEALDSLGEPLSKEQAAALDKAIATADADDAVEAIQKVLDQRCLVGV